MDLFTAGFASMMGGALLRSRVLTLLACLLIAGAAGIFLTENQTITATFYEIVPGLSFAVHIDRLAAFFMLTIAAVSFCVSLYSVEYINQYKHKGLLISLMNIFILSMLLTVAAGNTFSFLFFWELMALSSFFLVMFEYDNDKTRKAGLFYFIMTQLSTLFLFIAFSLLYSYTGTTSMEKIILQEKSTFLFLALFIGFGIKAGIIPFHKWLPYAHPASPSNISALMSGVMIKVAIYGLLRFLLVLPAELWWGLLILGAGTVSALLGVIYALKEHDIKGLLAYHSIENIGIIYMGIGLFVIFSHYNVPALAAMSMAAALFHTLNHALFKSLLFLTAGHVVHTTKTRNIDEMGGLIRQMPYTALLFLIGAMAISGLPPFNGFVSELLLFQALFNASAVHNPIIELVLIICLSLLALTSALAAACFVKAFGMIFLAMPRSAQKTHEASWPMLLGEGLLALACVILGIFSPLYLNSLGYALPNMMFIGGALLFSILFFFLLARANTRYCETWGCGLISQTPRMEYTASGFSEPIVTIFSTIYNPQKHVSKEFFDKSQTLVREGHVEFHLMRFFEEYLYMPIANAAMVIASRIDTLHQKDMGAYIAYVFIAAVILLLWVGWFA
ncbi:hydrogenase membrane subunit [Candidatus Woesearchaeota archaeon]|nr:hydrogenase membrane subunit [Candidatus Woesearchaeota archaeon]